MTKLCLRIERDLLINLFTKSEWTGPLKKSVGFLSISIIILYMIL